ncbi:MAG: RNA polymerase sigma factor RpoD, partial [Corallincola sp.]|nr:RNA polymerase sigma factor RpoD [Corallincola sp.]
MEQNPQSQLKALIAKGKEQGFLTFAEVNDHLPQEIVDSDQIEDIIAMINDMGIQVFEVAPDPDSILLADATTDEDVAEAAVQALSTVDAELGRTTDPVRMYMREMGTVELLTREGEIDIAKRIEEGINEVQGSVAEYPEAISYILDQFDRYQAGDMRLSEIISAFVDPNADDVPPAATHVGSELSSEALADEDNDGNDDEEAEGGDDTAEDTGIDPELAKANFDALRERYEQARATILAEGRQSPLTQQAVSELGEFFKQFRL